LDQQLAAINQRDADSQRAIADVQELYTSTEALANTIIKQEEDLTVHVCAINERAHAVEELEVKLLEREELDDLTLNDELDGLATRESTLTIVRLPLRRSGRLWRMHASMFSPVNLLPRPGRLV
jgi:hypothetical protein